MFKFNNEHIFTGYLKQLLASFHLPKCKVYTKELKEQQRNYEANKALWEADLAHYTTEKTRLKIQLAENLTKINSAETPAEDLPDLKATHKDDLTEYYQVLTQINKLTTLLANVPEVISTVYHSEYDVYPDSLAELPIKLDYDAKMRYVPYLKDGYLQEYVDGKWHKCHASFSQPHKNFHEATKTPYAINSYSYGQKILNYTKNLKIQNTVYDSYTHEYLGDYLRFHRDFANINLMPLYNCFSNRACPRIDLKIPVSNTYEAVFKTDQSFETTLYKYYMVPVKFFKDYTIAIDSGTSIEMCCCIYTEYFDENTDFAEVPKLTYQCFSDLQFRTPVLYSKLKNLNSLLLTDKSDLCQYEDCLKLILKVPATNNSSIVILEGDYTAYNDSVAKPTHTFITETLPSGVEKTKQIFHSFLKENNKTVINYENLDACELLADKLITPLQLLRTNTGESYPFADRLVEYLVGNAITANEEIQDNIVRAKTVISRNCPEEICPIVAEEGIWEPILQCLVYDYINKKQNINDINHDILGFIDKDVEKWYTAKAKTSAETIANIDIYKD